MGVGGGDANRLQTSITTLGQNRGKLNQSFDKGRRAETEALIVAMWSALSPFESFVAGLHNTL